MVSRIWAALPLIFVVWLLLVILTFTFAIILAEVPSSHDSFSTVSKSILTLVIRGVFLDSPGILIHDLLRHNMTFHVASFMLFIFLCGYVVMNLLIGILCEIVRGATQTQKSLKDAKDEQFLRDNLMEILDCYDRNDDGFLDVEEFHLALQNPDLHNILTKCGVNVKDFLQFAGLLFQEQANGRKRRGLSNEKFLETVLRMRGNNSTTVADFVAFREYLEHRLNHLRILVMTGRSDPDRWSMDSKSLSKVAAAAKRSNASDYLAMSLTPSTL
jgi:hypothetical protein